MQAQSTGQPIDVKVAVERENGRRLQSFRSGDKRCIRQVHWAVVVLSHQFGGSRHLFLRQIAHHKTGVKRPSSQLILSSMPTDAAK